MEQRGTLLNVVTLASLVLAHNSRRKIRPAVGKDMRAVG
jgi:hypothetical protein